MRSFKDPDCPAWSQETGSVLTALAVDAQAGLDPDEVVRRRAKYGRNELVAQPSPSILSIIAAQFRSIVVLLLIGAALLAVLFRDIPEALAIFAVILVNASIGFLTEWRATRSMEALRRFAQIDCLAVRAGSVVKLPAADLVPGDIVILEAGELVPADLRLLESAKLGTDESALTGESLPITKHVRPVSPDTSMLDRKNMAYKGTVVTRGSGRGVVVTTGVQTEFGKIFEQVGSAESQRTPLEKRLDALGKRLAWVAAAIAAGIALAGIAVGRDAYLAIEVAVALAVAAIPEGLPIVATIALARGTWGMARRNALVTRLSAVETLGATSLILTDKTGTLTENRMAVTRVLLAGDDIDVTRRDGAAQATFGSESGDLAPGSPDLLDALLTIGALCSGASLARDGRTPGVGDPTEVALLEAAAARQCWREDLLDRFPEIREEPFDPGARRMATVHEADGRYLVAVKGAPEVVFGLCDRELMAGGERALSAPRRHEWLERVEALGAAGLRTLALARKYETEPDVAVFGGLVLLGVAGLADPPRAGVDRAIESCQHAGIDVIMVTGDHLATARNIARDVGIAAGDAPASVFVDGRELEQLLAGERTPELAAARVFARVTPEQKLRLIDLYQQRGHVVAMTGDGVNDAPALKKADIGVAMGIRGTAVAKGAAKMVLQDDELGTIVAAIGHGRVIFENIRKFVVYLLSCNMSEVLIVALATVASAPLPLLPLQILFLNLVTDVFPALALGVGRGSAALLRSPPRPTGEPILRRFDWLRITLFGILMAVTVLGAMAFAVFRLGFDNDKAVSVAFLTLALAQLWHVFNMRRRSASPIRNEITSNAWIWAAILLCLLLILVAVFLPGLRDILKLVNPGSAGWLLIVVASCVPLAAGPLIRRLAERLAL